MCGGSGGIVNKIQVFYAIWWRATLLGQMAPNRIAPVGSAVASDTTRLKIVNFYVENTAGQHVPGDEIVSKSRRTHYRTEFLTYREPSTEYVTKVGAVDAARKMHKCRPLSPANLPNPRLRRIQVAL